MVVPPTEPPLAQGATMSEHDTSRRVTISDAAAILGVSKPTIRRLIASGQLPAYRIGNGARPTIRLDVADVQAVARPLTVKASR